MGSSIFAAKGVNFFCYFCFHKSLKFSFEMELFLEIGLLLLSLRQFMDLFLLPLSILVMSLPKFLKFLVALSKEERST